jgi:hypothetical protein
LGALRARRVVWAQPASKPRQWRSASCGPTSIAIISITVSDTGTTTDTAVTTTTTTTTTVIIGVSDGLLLAAGRGG